MRLLAALLVSAVAACSGDAPSPVAPTNSGGVPVATGDVHLSLHGEFPDLHFPLTVGYPGGSAQIPDGKEHVITVPASDSELARIEIEGWRPVWVRVPVGGSVRLSTHPCCGITFDSNTYDDELATCASADDVCSGETELAPHSLAEDAVCGERKRCVPRAKLRVVQTATAGPAEVIDEGGEHYLASRDPAAPLQPVDRNIADMFSFAVDGATARQDIGMDAGMAYTVFLDGTEVTRIGVTKW